MVTTNHAELAEKIRLLRSHGITTDHRQREEQGTWAYDMTSLGYNYRLTDIQCALGLSQLAKQPKGLARRRALAARYSGTLDTLPLQLPYSPPDRTHAWHLYPIRLAGADPSKARELLYGDLRRAGIGVNVHYRPIYLHSYYRSLGYTAGLCPVAELAYNGLLSLPIWHGMTEAQQDRVISVLADVIDARA
jgi:perosamine synthetase